MKDKQHYHRYRKVKMGKAKDYIVYQCAESDCTHYIQPLLLVGKVARCFHCRDLFTVSREQVRIGRQYLKLHCPACSKIGHNTYGKEQVINKEKNVSPELVNDFLNNLGFSSED